MKAMKMTAMSNMLVTGPNGIIPGGECGSVPVPVPSPITAPPENTPLETPQVKFEFPDMSEDAKTKARQTSLTEFNNFLRKL